MKNLTPVVRSRGMNEFLEKLRRGTFGGAYLSGHFHAFSVFLSSLAFTYWSALSSSTQ